MKEYYYCDDCKGSGEGVKFKNFHPGRLILDTGGKVPYTICNACWKERLK